MKTINCSEIQVGDKVRIPRGAHINPKNTELDREAWIIDVDYVNGNDDFITVIGSSFQLELHHSHQCTLLNDKVGQLIHITHEGVYAGIPLCGVKREASNGSFSHYGKWAENPDLNVCKKCLKVWEEE